jgi:hypothetical protein
MALKTEGQSQSHIFKDISLSITAHFQGYIHLNNRTFSKSLNVVIHLRHPPSRGALLRTGGYGEQDVIVLTIPMLAITDFWLR